MLHNEYQVDISSASIKSVATNTCDILHFSYEEALVQNLFFICYKQHSMILASQGKQEVHQCPEGRVKFQHFPHPLIHSSTQPTRPRSLRHCEHFELCCWTALSAPEKSSVLVERAVRVQKKRIRPLVCHSFVLLLWAVTYYNAVQPL